MGTEKVFEGMPFLELLGIEVTYAKDGYAEGKIEMKPELSSIPSKTVAHGGVPFALADTVGGAAVVSTTYTPTPTIDMRIDYLNPALKDLFAEAEVVRNGDTSAVMEISVYDKDEQDIARVRGVYKTGELKEDSPHSVKRQRDSE